MVRLKHGVIFVGFMLFGWVGVRTYTYFFDTTNPIFAINGLETGSHYCGDVQCLAQASKTGEVSVWLDGQPLISKFKINSRELEHSFTVPTRTLTNGQHHLKAELIDTRFHKNKAIIERDFTVDNVPLQVAFVRPDTDHKVFQGRTLHLQFQVNKQIKQAKVRALSKTFNCFPEIENSLVYECFIPMACEESPNEYLLAVDVTDHVGNNLTLDNKFQIVMFPFKKQVLRVSEDKVQEEQEMGLDKKQFEVDFQQAWQNSLPKKLWRGTFCAPIDIVRVTNEFGTIRTTQHKGRYAHKAIDVINTPKSVVWAPQHGVVTIKERYAETGNTVVIDHGCGVMSLVCHLDSFADIAVGEKIAQGNPVGKLGKTGYATGYHLHWAHFVEGVPVDPMQWTKVTF